MRFGQQSTDMTTGSISGRIVGFAAPLFLGYVCQQLYSTVDAVVVGNFVGQEALAAVGSSNAPINLLIGFFMGLAVGAGVVISRRFGEKDEQGVSRAVHTTVLFGLIISVLLTAAGVALTPALLRLMGTPEDVLPNSILYFRIYFYGILTVVMYNIGSSIFRAMGDSVRPLLYLIVSSILNVALDLLFVCTFNMGIAGAAWATVISQGVSMVMTFARLMRVSEAHRLDLKKLRIHRAELREIVGIGLPNGVQASIVSLSNVVVQSNINSFGAAAMAGCGACGRIDGFAGIPVTCFMMAAMTFVSQNLGAKQYGRAKKGARFSLIAAVATSELIGAVLFIFAPQLISLFNADPEVVAYGAQYTRDISLVYCLLAVSHVVSGILRGAGISKVPMYVTVACWCGLRMLWISLTVPMFRNIRFVYFGYPLTWACSAIILLIIYKKLDWQHAYERRPAHL